MNSFVKRASTKDLYKIAYAIMCLKTTSESITTEEVKHYVDRCYYCEDRSGNIIAIIAAERIVFEYPSEVEGETIKTYPNKYRIKYMLYDAYAIKSMGEDPAELLREMVRELTADMSDWTVSVNLSKLSKISIDSEEDCKETLKYALNSNGFRNMSDEDLMLRATPLNFDSFH